MTGLAMLEECGGIWDFGLGKLLNCQSAILVGVWKTINSAEINVNMKSSSRVFRGEQYWLVTGQETIMLFGQECGCFFSLSRTCLRVN